MNPIPERTQTVVVWKSLTLRTVGPLALNDRLRALSRAAASLEPGLAEQLGLRPEVAVRCLENRCLEKSSSVVTCTINTTSSSAIHADSSAMRPDVFAYCWNASQNRDRHPCSCAVCRKTPRPSGAIPRSETTLRVPRSLRRNFAGLQLRQFGEFSEQTFTSKRVVFFNLANSGECLPEIKQHVLCGLMLLCLCGVT